MPNRRLSASLALFALLSTVSALGAPAAAQEPQIFIVPAKPKASTSPDAPRWYSSVRDAFAEAQRSQRPLLVDLFAEWCGWCKVMDAKVFATPEFAELGKSYVLLRIDVEDGGQGSELASRYDSQSLPTLLLLEPKGALIGLVRGFKPVDELIAESKAIHAVHEKSLATYEKLLSSSDAESIRRAASDLYGRRDGERAAKLFARLIEIAPSSGDEAVWLRFFLADSLRRAERFEAATAALEQARALAIEVGDPELAERLALLPFWIAKDAAQCANASGALADFERGHPASVFLPGAKRALAELRSGRTTCS